MQGPQVLKNALVPTMLIISLIFFNLFGRARSLLGQRQSPLFTKFANVQTVGIYRVCKPYPSSSAPRGINFAPIINFCPSLKKKSVHLKLANSENSVSIQHAHLNATINNNDNYNINLTLRHVALLISLWRAVAFPDPSVESTDFLLKDYGLNRNQVRGLLQHFQNCKECAGKLFCTGGQS